MRFPEGAEPDLFTHSSETQRTGPPLWSVSEINHAARMCLEEGFADLWVGGEVGNWTRAGSGHRYFTLKDEEAQLRCVMWRRDAERLPAEPEEGMKVRAFGKLTIYPARGEYQFSVRRLEGEGEEGLWRLAFERIRRRLDEEGLLDPARKRAIPRFPAAVGVVTSLEGAALRDILTVIRRRAPWTRVVVRGSRVQGEGASDEIASAIRVLGGSGTVEVMIVSRGGGSIEDLWAFNEEPVARAIAECPVPVISGVGHEVDVTIADLVADVRAPTPSSAGETAVQDRAVLLGALQGVQPRLIRGLRRLAERPRARLQEGSIRKVRAMQGLIGPRRTLLERRSSELASVMRRASHQRRERLTALAGQVDALSPLATLRRGYAVPLDDASRVLRSVARFHPGDAFDLRVVDGRVRCETIQVSQEAVD